MMPPLSRSSPARYRGLLALGALVTGAACGHAGRVPAATGPAEVPQPAPHARPQGPPDDDGPISAGDRSAAVEALIAALDHHYVFPDKAKALGQALRDHLRRGDYDAMSRGQAFAQALTDHMVSLVHDQHLTVRYFAAPVAEVADERPPPEMEAEEAAEMRYLNHGIFDVRRLRFDVGYLAFHVFGPGEAFATKLAAAMHLVHDTQALIVDLRDCHGGATDSVALAESYLVPANTHLLDMYTRDTDTTERVVAVADLAGPRYPSEQPVFILTSDVTASGCEAFAYAMQAQRRATVIGTRTAGAAYFGDPRRLTDHFMAFVPVGRPIDPITHGDWEGTGVTPQVAATVEKAQDVAERAILTLLAAREPSTKRRAAMLERIAALGDTSR